MRAYDTDTRASRTEKAKSTTFDTGDAGAFLGPDDGKTAHHGHRLTPAGKKISDKPLPDSDTRLRAAFDKPAATFDTVLVIADQPASTGALPLTVARDTGRKVAYPPGPATRRTADLHPDETKTDAKDAAITADTARTMPHTPRSPEPTDETTTELTALAGSDQDPAAETTPTPNRIPDTCSPTSTETR